MATDLAANAITKSTFADAENITNSSQEKIQLNAACAQTKKNFPVKNICFFILKKCTLTRLTLTSKFQTNSKFSKNPKFPKNAKFAKHPF